MKKYYGNYLVGLQSHWVAFAAMMGIDVQTLMPHARKSINQVAGEYLWLLEVWDLTFAKQKGASVHTVKLYVDAGLVGTDNSASGFAVTNNSPLELGRIQTGATTYNAGYFDEMGIWSKALSQDAVTALYNSGNGLTY